MDKEKQVQKSSYKIAWKKKIETWLDTGANRMVTVTRKAAEGNFGVNISKFFVFYWGKKSHNTHWQIFVSDSILRELCFLMPLYLGLVKMLLLPSYLPNQWHSVFSALIGQSALCFLVTGDISTSWLAVCAFCSNSPNCRQQNVCEPHHHSAQAQAETDQFTPLQLSLQPFGLSSNWT